jgi:uncharacterized protein YbjT (DUF2867 family)
MGKSKAINKFKSYLRFMDQRQKTAIVLGATGLTGGILLRELLEDPRYGRVLVFSRSPVGMDHPRLEEHLGDLMSLSEFKVHFKADEVYCCIGTTKAKTPDQEKYRAIDFGIPVSAARLCSENGIGAFLVISSLGADPGSRIFYSKVKGEMEEAVLQQGIARTYILQPSIIGGERNENRMGEQIAKKLFSALKYLLIGPLKKYRSIPPEAIARAMIWLANSDYPQHRITSDKINEIAHA